MDTPPLQPSSSSGSSRSTTPTDFIVDDQLPLWIFLAVLAGQFNALIQFVSLNTILKH